MPLNQSRANSIPADVLDRIEGTELHEAVEAKFGKTPFEGGEIFGLGHGAGPYCCDIEPVKRITLKDRPKTTDPLVPGNRCRDRDADCEHVRDKVACWFYDPEQGWCPYLLGRAV